MELVSARSWIGMLLSTMIAIEAVVIVLTPAHQSPPKVTLRVLAGSELSDLIAPANATKEFRDRLARDTGVTLDVNFTGSLTGAETIAAEGDAYDVAWFASDSYLKALAPSQIQAGVSIMRSPVIFGVKHSIAQEFGWLASAPTWQQIAAKVAAKNPVTGHGFTFAMTDPAASNSGLAALAAAAGAITNARDPSTSDLDRAAPTLTALFSGDGAVDGGVRLTAESSGWLISSYAQGQDELDGLVNYESELRSLQQRPPAGLDQLDLIYPANGVVVADYPLMQLANIDSARAAAYGRLSTWLRGSWAQDWIVGHTQRRSVRTADGSEPGQGAVGTFPALRQPRSLPADKTGLDHLILDYHNTYRRPPTTIFVVDKSGSMADPVGNVRKIDDLAHVFDDLAGDSGDSPVQQFAEFRNREDVTILPFDASIRGQVRADGSLSSLRPAIHQIINSAEGTRAQDRLVAQVRTIVPSGSTALFDALYEAYWLLAQDVKKAGGDYEGYAAGRYPTIVLLTDGVSNGGMNFAQFKRLWNRLPSRSIPVFSVYFGDTPVAKQCTGPKQPSLCSISSLTHGKVFDTSNGQLLDVMREIRGYQ